MKILMLLKTADGGQWAARLTLHLKNAGVEVYAVLPNEGGMCGEEWRSAAKEIFYCDTNLRSKKALSIKSTINYLRELADEINPDLVHSFDVDSAIAARLSFRKSKRPLIFHVPGPLHLENIVTRKIEILTAGLNDFWIASSEYIRQLYRHSGISEDRIFLSYFGVDVDKIVAFRNDSENYRKTVRAKYNIPEDGTIMMNVSYFYAPKVYLGQFLGLKNHENMIKAMEHILRRRNDVNLVLVGRQWGDRTGYEERLKEMARNISENKIKFIGYLPQQQVYEILNIADLILHVPISENCGGIIEPTLIGKPVIASNVGGLPEIVEEGKTGWLTKSTRDIDIAEKVLEILSKRDQWPGTIRLAQQKVEEMFDIRENARAVMLAYGDILGRG